VLTHRPADARRAAISALGRELRDLVQAAVWTGAPDEVLHRAADLPPARPLRTPLRLLAHVTARQGNELSVHGSIATAADPDTPS